MKIKFEVFRRQPPLKGWCVWDIDCWTREISLCRWWVYPAMKLYCFFRYLRVGLYHWLNLKDIMKTPLGNSMVLSDIWRRSSND